MTKGERTFIATDYGDFVGVLKSIHMRHIVLENAVKIVVSKLEEFLYTGRCDERFQYRYPDELNIFRSRIRYTTFFRHKIPGEDILAYPETERLLHDLGGD